jgi:hypothetical protein
VTPGEPNTITFAPSVAAGATITMSAPDIALAALATAGTSIAVIGPGGGPRIKINSARITLPQGAAAGTSVEFRQLDFFEASFKASRGGLSFTDCTLTGSSLGTGAILLDGLGNTAVGDLALALTRVAISGYRLASFAAGQSYAPNVNWVDGAAVWATKATITATGGASRVWGLGIMAAFCRPL